MLTLEWYKIFGPLSVLLTWSSIVYILLRIPRDLAHSISHHAAQRKEEYRIFASVMTASLICMALFVVKWLAPSLQLHGYLTAIFLIAILLEAVTTWIPLTNGRQYIVHQWCSYGTAVIIPIILILLALSPRVHGLAFYADILATIFLFGFWLMFFFIKKTREQYLIYQNLYIAAFHFALLSMLFVS